MQSLHRLHDVATGLKSNTDSSDHAWQIEAVQHMQGALNSLRLVPEYVCNGNCVRQRQSLMMKIITLRDSY